MAEKPRLVIHLGTGNLHKAEEFRRMAPSGVTVIPSFSEECPSPEVVEEGESFFLNALSKAEAFARSVKGKLTGILFADDSGLVVPALSGEPGVHSARYAGERATDAQNRDLLLQKMKGLSAEERKAYFVCVLVAVDISTGKIVASGAGKVFGRIAKGLMGEGGFGYDPLFVPEGYHASFGVMAPSEKNSISHRFLAFRHLCQSLVTP